MRGAIDEGLTLVLDARKLLEVFAENDFAGFFDKFRADDPTSEHAGFSIIWKSKLQSEIALSTTEVEHIALSSALRETMPLMPLIK